MGCHQTVACVYACLRGSSVVSHDASGIKILNGHDHTVTSAQSGHDTLWFLRGAYTICRIVHGNNRYGSFLEHDYLLLSMDT